MLGFDFDKKGKLTPRFQNSCFAQKACLYGADAELWKSVYARSTAIEPAGSAPLRSWTLLWQILRLEGIIMFMYSDSLIDIGIIEQWD